MEEEKTIEPKEVKKLAVSKILLIALAFLVIVGGGYILYAKYSSTDEPTESTSQAENDNSATEDSVSADSELSSTDTGDSQLEADLNSTDSGLNSLEEETKNVDSGLNDQQLDLSEE